MGKRKEYKFDPVMLYPDGPLLSEGHQDKERLAECMQEYWGEGVYSSEFVIYGWAKKTADKYGDVMYWDIGETQVRGMIPVTYFNETAYYESLPKEAQG